MAGTRIALTEGLVSTVADFKESEQPRGLNHERQNPQIKSVPQARINASQVIQCKKLLALEVFTSAQQNKNLYYPPQVLI